MATQLKQYLNDYRHFGLTARMLLGKFLALALAGSLLQHTLHAQTDDNRPIRSSVRGTHVALAGGSELTLQACLRVIHNGGNAVDAGVAGLLAGAVVEFSHYGFGGEAPILLRTADGQVYSLAGVGTMPRLATVEFFRQNQLHPSLVDPGGRFFGPPIPTVGLLPALVPGMVDAALAALQHFGTKSFSEVAAPAIELAEGHPIDEIRADTIFRLRAYLMRWPTSYETFLPKGRSPRPGEIFRQPNLARTLRSMVAAETRALRAGKSREEAIEAVRDYFYRGEIARKIAAFCEANGGLLRYEDFASFHVEPEKPVQGTYHDYTVLKPGFWSQGPVMIQILNIIEEFPLRQWGHNSAEYIHHIVEAMKLAFADRDTYYGDPKFATIPAETLLSKQYAASRRKLIGPRASTEFRPGVIASYPIKHPANLERVQARIDPALKARDTTCLNIIDANGVMFSATPSGAWMPSVIAGDTGIPLTQRAQSFFLIEGHPNVLEGGKRPRVTLSPTLVLKEGKPFMALSTPGGDTQDQSLLQLFLNVVEFGMDAEEAVEAPRFRTRHYVSSFDDHEARPNQLFLDDRIPAQVVEELSARGHQIFVRSPWRSGSAPVIVLVRPDGVLEAGADPYGRRVAHAY